MAACTRKRKNALITANRALCVRAELLLLMEQIARDGESLLAGGAA